ncbi:hypothetical protein [Thiofilum flexile]|uniref:hypothetical protein n=1 Tax=Thiofilum flexile TaxID=125627 RepID=UPI00038225B8|nr:hypothetical protein [Thiofilum flexile]
MPADNTLLPTLGNTATTQIPFEYDNTHAQLVILQNAFRSVLNCAELRDADPPMLDTLDALTEHFRELLNNTYLGK